MLYRSQGGSLPVFEAIFTEFGIDDTWCYELIVMANDVTDVTGVTRSDAECRPSEASGDWVAAKPSGGATMGDSIGALRFPQP